MTKKEHSKSHYHHEGETHESKHHVEHHAKSEKHDKNSHVLDKKKTHEHTAKHTHDVHNKTNEHKNHVHKDHKSTKKKQNIGPWVFGGIALVIILIVVFIKLNGSHNYANIDNPEQYGSADVTFHVMSQCPYGTQVEDGFYPVWKEFKDNLNFRLEFIAEPTNNGFNSLHGQPEVYGDLLHACAQELYPETFMDFIVCQNKNYHDLVSSIDSCSKDANIDADKLKACADGDKGKSLLTESAAKSMAAQASASPTVFVGGAPYQGGRDDASFKRAVCGQLKSHPACADIPICSTDMDCQGEPGKIGVCNNAGKKDAKCSYETDAKIELTIVNSAECDNCDTAPLVNALRQAFMNMEVKVVDATSVEGKDLVKKYQIELAPSFIFKNVENTYAWKNNPRIPPAFRKVNDDYVLIDEATGAKFVIDPVKRAEIKEKTGVVKGDNKPQIDFYVMSYCPYGNMAEEAIEPVFRLLKNKAEFNPHYVIYSNYQGGGPNYCLDDENLYCSMHGIQELNQGLREICVNKYLGIEAYFDFVLKMNKECSYKNADTCWEAVAESLSLDTTKIKDCETNEWEDILSAELELNKLLGVRGSPTVFVEGESYNGPRTAAGFAESLCNGFENKPTECAKLGTLGSTTTEAPAGGCGN